MRSDQSILERRVEQAVWGIVLGTSVLFVVFLPWISGRGGAVTTNSLVDLALTPEVEHDRALPILMLMLCSGTLLAAWWGAAQPKYFGLAALVGFVTLVMLFVMIFSWAPHQSGDITYGMHLAAI